MTLPGKCPRGKAGFGHESAALQANATEGKQGLATSQPLYRQMPPRESRVWPRVSRSTGKCHRGKAGFGHESAALQANATEGKQGLATSQPLYRQMPPRESRVWPRVSRSTGKCHRGKAGFGQRVSRSTKANATEGKQGLATSQPLYRQMPPRESRVGHESAALQANAPEGKQGLATSQPLYRQMPPRESRVWPRVSRSTGKCPRGKAGFGHESAALQANAPEGKQGLATSQPLYRQMPPRESRGLATSQPLYRQMPPRESRVWPRVSRSTGKCPRGKAGFGHESAALQANAPEGKQGLATSPAALQANAPEGKQGLATSQPLYRQMPPRESRVWPRVSRSTGKCPRGKAGFGHESAALQANAPEGKQGLATSQPLYRQMPPRGKQGLATSQPLYRQMPPRESRVWPRVSRSTGKCPRGKAGFGHESAALQAIATEGKQGLATSQPLYRQMPPRESRVWPRVSRSTGKCHRGGTEEEEKKKRRSRRRKRERRGGRLERRREKRKDEEEQEEKKKDGRRKRRGRRRRSSGRRRRSKRFYLH